MTDPGSPDTDRFLDIELPHAFRGLDPEAVQALLTEAVGSLRESERRQDELRATITELEAALAEARSEATAELEEAKRRGREMVAEAQTVRRRILEDLARRRKVLRRQIEQLRVGRERLLEAYEVVGHTVEEATQELGVALPAAHAAAERAGRGLGADTEPTEEDLYALEAEIDAARAAGLPILDPPTASEQAAAAGPRVVADEHEVPGLIEVEVEVAAFEEVRVLGPAGPEAVEVEVGDEEPAPEAPVGEGPADATVLPLFDRLREADDRVDEPASAPDPIEVEPAGPEGAEDPVAVLADDLARRLRRALADEQNHVLDRLRQDRRGQLGLDDLLGDVDTRVARLATAVEPRLQEAATANASGAEAAGLAAHLAGEVVDGVRADIDLRVGAEVVAADLARPLREAFRVWRTDRLLPLATAAATRAVNG